jgi:hypothetical protein
MVIFVYFMYDMVYFFLFQLGAFRNQSLERMSVCILVQIEPFESC